jgi:hypothetical protein
MTDKNGAIAPVFAFFLPSMLALMGGAADYAALNAQKAKFSALADSTALSVAREMSLVRMSDDQAQSAAESFLRANSNGLTNLRVLAKIKDSGMAVDVTVGGEGSLPVGILMFSGVLSDLAMKASATARLEQQTKLCLLSVSEVATDPIWSGTTNVKLNESTGIHLMRGARITANGCVLHTNVAGANAVQIEAGASVKADLICAAGGVRNSGGTVVGQVIQDCPPVRNPMDMKPKGIPHRTCIPGSEQGTVISNGTHKLDPGSYCGDIIISGDAKVRLNPGTYRIRGALIVKDNAELVGERVGFYFSSVWKAGKVEGQVAYFRFTGNSLIDISAPETGEMAGILIWESVNSAATEGRYSTTRDSNYHQISSARAKRLTGTIYLPVGRLLIDAPHRIADESDYTVLLVNRLDLSNGPNLVLNSNYAKSRVPVPEGLGPIGSKFVKLEK